MAGKADLFGYAPAQGSLFGSGEDRLQPPVQRYLPDPEKIRRRLHALLETARAAERLPWPERDARVWQIVFPNMANWLPDAEAEQLRLEFAREIERLSRVAEPPAFATPGRAPCRRSTPISPNLPSIIRASGEAFRLSGGPNRVPR